LRRQGRGKEARMLTGRYRPTMKFAVGGKTVFARKVRGFAANPFMGPAADTAGGQAQATIGKMIVREIEAIKT
jgi:hypothetical protein